MAALEGRLTAGPGDSRHVAFVLPNLQGGGAERVALYLAKRLVKLGHRVDLVLVEGSGQLLEIVPPEIRVVDLGAARLRSAILPLARYLRRERPDAVQARLWPLTIIAIVARLLARSKARLVVSDHATLSRQYSGSTLRLLKWSVRLFYPLADARVLVSRGAADDLARLSGLERTTFEVIYNPLPEAGNDELPKAVDWAADGSRIISVGALKIEKNHALLIRAFARVRRNRTAKLMIVGEGPLRSALLHEAKSLGVANDLLLPGFILNPAPLLASADLFVLSSDHEGFGNVLVEALREGLRIVATDCPSGPAEILDRGKFGVLVPTGDASALADAIEQALEVPPAAEAQKARAKEISGEVPVMRYVALLTGAGSR